MDVEVWGMMFCRQNKPIKRLCGAIQRVSNSTLDPEALLSSVSHNQKGLLLSILFILFH